MFTAVEVVLAASGDGAQEHALVRVLASVPLAQQLGDVPRDGYLLIVIRD